MLPIDMNINFILAHFEQRSKISGDLCFLFSSWRKVKLVEEKVPAAHVLFESLIPFLGLYPKEVVRDYGQKLTCKLFTVWFSLKPGKQKGEKKKRKYML